MTAGGGIEKNERWDGKRLEIRISPPPDSRKTTTTCSIWGEGVIKPRLVSVLHGGWGGRPITPEGQFGSEGRSTAPNQRQRLTVNGRRQVVALHARAGDEKDKFPRRVLNLDPVTLSFVMGFIRTNAGDMLLAAIASPESN